MTKRFRLGLFLALAAAVGLHLRPCLGCLVADAVETVARGPAVRGSSFSGGGLASILSPRRPSMMAMAVGPVSTATSQRVAAEEGSTIQDLTSEFSSESGFRSARPAVLVLPASSVQPVGFRSTINVR